MGSGSPAAAASDAMIVLLDAAGKPVPGFGTGGRILPDLGGPGGAWFGVTPAADGATVTVVGYEGADPAAEGSNDDAAVARLDL